MICNYFLNFKTNKMRLFRRPPKQLLINLSYGVTLAILIIATYKKHYAVNPILHDCALFFAIRLAILNAVKSFLSDYFKIEK